MKRKNFVPTTAEEIESTKKKLDKAYLKFSLADDFLLTDEAVFEIKSLEAKYTYLLRKMKTEELL